MIGISFDDDRTHRTGGAWGPMSASIVNTGSVRATDIVLAVTRVSVRNAQGNEVVVTPTGHQFALRKLGEKGDRKPARLAPGEALFAQIATVTHQGEQHYLTLYDAIDQRDRITLAEPGALAIDARLSWGPRTHVDDYRITATWQLVEQGPHLEPQLDLSVELEF